MRVLVSGGTGLLGGAVRQYIEDRGHEVIVDPSADDIALERIDGIVHDAGLRPGGGSFPRAVHAAATDGSELSALLQRLDTVGFTGRVVVAGSASVYGESAILCAEHGPMRADRQPDDLAAGSFDPLCPFCRSPLQAFAPDERSATRPRHPAAASSLHQEHLWSFFQDAHPAASVLSLRLTTMYGPGIPLGDDGGVVAACLGRVIAGERPVVFEDGQQERDFVYVDDVAAAIEMALTAETSHRGPLNVGSGRRSTVLTMATTLCALSGSPHWPDVTGTARTGDLRHNVVDPSLVASVLGFRAAWSLADGMASTWKGVAGSLAAT